MKLYDLSNILDFGQCKGETLAAIFEKNPAYIDWCFQKIDWFCITNEIFDKLPIIIYLRKQSDKDSKSILNGLKEKHLKKIEILKTEFSNNNSIESCTDDRYYNDRNWLSQAAGTDDPETMNDVYWNLD